MNMLQDFHAAHLARVARLSRPQVRTRQRLPVKIIPIINGRQVFPLAPPPPRQKIRLLPIVPQRERPSVAEVLSAVAEAHGVSVADIFYGGRKVNLVWPRHVAMFLAREITGISLPDLGRRMGGFDHTSILYAIDKVRRVMAADAAKATAINGLRDAILRKNAVKPEVAR